MLYLLRTKTSRLIYSFLFLLFSFQSFDAYSQRPTFQDDHDNKPYYFGITLAGSLSRFQTELHSHFLEQDSIMIAEPGNAGGFALGLSATTRLSNRFEGRFNPQLAFMDRSIF